MKTCSCGAQMIWAMTPKGEKAPLCAEPSDDGNVLLLAPTGLDTPLAVTFSGEGLEHARRCGVALRLNHFANCPDRADFKK